MADIEEERLSEGQQKKMATIKRSQSDKYGLYYSSNTQVRGSFFDIRIIAGEIVPDDNNEVVFREDVSIVFSPQHAKIVSKLLSKQIEDYEKKYGDIPNVGGSEVSLKLFDTP